MKSVRPIALKSSAHEGFPATTMIDRSLKRLYIPGAKPEYSSSELHITIISGSAFSNRADSLINSIKPIVNNNMITRTPKEIGRKIRSCFSHYGIPYG